MIVWSTPSFSRLRSLLLIYPWSFVFSATVGLLIAPITCHGQIGLQDFGNRLEGLVEMEFTGSQITLVSVTQYKEPFPTGQEFNLEVEFYLPKSTSDVRLKAVDLYGRNRYLMLSKPREWKRNSLNLFDGWSTSSVLMGENLGGADIGIVAEVRKNETALHIRTYLPVILKTKELASPSKYTFTFRTAARLHKSLYWIYDESENTQINNGQHEQEVLSNGIFSIVIDSSSWTDGWKILKIRSQLYNSPPDNREIRFYHKSH